MRRIFLVLTLWLVPVQAMAAELLLFDTRGCYWCERWISEVGPYYHKTREGQIAPLRLVSLDKPRPVDLTWIQGVRASPTFVLIDQGREIGRIVGYDDEQVFWARLGEMMRGVRITETHPTSPQSF